MSWKSMQLSDVAEVFNGKTPSKSEQRDEGHPVLKIKNVDESGSFKGSFESFVDPELADKFENKRLKLDDSLVLNAAHNSDYVGSKQYRAESSVVDALPTGEWLVARAKGDNLHPRFLNYWIASPQARFQIKYLVKGIHLYPKDVARLEIPVPPLKEQKRIAAILDKADAIRRKRQQAIQLSDQFLCAVFLDMFGDPVTNPKELDKKPLGELIKVTSGNGLTAAQMDKSGEYSVYGGNGINGKHNEYMFEEPKIVIGRVGFYCGAIHITEPRSWVTDNALYIKEFKEEINKDYLAEALKVADLNQYAGKAAQPLVSGNRIYPVEILLPDRSEQEKFSEIKVKIDKFTEQLNSAGEYSNELFNSLAQKAFAGDL